MAWWDCRSRSPLSFPSRICKNHGRDWEESKLKKVNNEGENLQGRLGNHWGRRAPFIGPPKSNRCSPGAPRPDTPVSLRPGVLNVVTQRLKSKKSARHWSFRRAHAGVSGFGKTDRNTNTKTVITWASELCFRWTRARFEDNNELYKIMQRNIIVQQVSIKPNEERFNLSIKE